MKTLGIRLAIIASICLFTFTGNLSGQSKVIELWNGKIPGAIHNESHKQIVDSADNWTKMRLITDPTLDMYPAPAETANGTAVIICPGGAYWGLAIEHEGAQDRQIQNRLGLKPVGSGLKQEVY